MRMGKGRRSLRVFAWVIVFVTWVAPSMLDATVTPCNQNLMARLGSGILASPNFPLNYSVTGRQCIYRIYSSSASPTHIRFVNMPPTAAKSTHKTETPNSQSPGYAPDVAVNNRWRDPASPGEEMAESAEVVCFRFQRFSIGNSPKNCVASTGYAYLEFPGGVRYCNKGRLSTLVTEKAPVSVFEDAFCWPIPNPYLSIKFSYQSTANYTDTGFYATYNITKVWDIRDSASERLVSQSKAPCEDFACFDNQACVLRKHLCNGVDDCQDGSDEDYSNARCKGQQDYSGCDFESLPGTQREKCNFSGFSWVHDKASRYGPRYDHTIGITRGSTVAGSPIVWSRTGHQGSLWLPGEVDLSDNINTITELGFLGTKGDSTDANIAIDDLSLSEGACYGDDISCTFELGTCGWHLDNGNNFSFWKRHKGSPANLTGPQTDCTQDVQGFYMHTDFGSEPGTRAVRMVSRPISGLSSQLIWCLTYCYYRVGDQSQPNSAQLSIKLKHVNGIEKLVHTVERGTDGYWDEQRLLLEGVMYPLQVIFEAVSSGGVDISVDSITMIPDSSACYSRITPSPPPVVSTVSPHPVTCAPRHFRCNNGACVSRDRMCDGRFDCKDFSDENNCDPAGMSIGAIAGIVTGLLLAITMFLTSFLWVRWRSSFLQRQPPRPESLPAGDFTGQSIYGEPPPLYTEIEVPSTTTQHHPLTTFRHNPPLAVSWEPPPMYDFNPMLNTGPVVPVYTPRFEPPPFEEHLPRLLRSLSRETPPMPGKAEENNCQCQSGNTGPHRVSDGFGEQQQQQQGTPEEASQQTNGCFLAQSRNLASVDIVGMSATGEELHTGFNTHQPVVYHVPNRYRRSFRRPFQRRSRRHLRSQLNCQPGSRHQFPNGRNDHVSNSDQIRQVSDESTEV